jgi:hypothetical protein
MLLRTLLLLVLLASTVLAQTTQEKVRDFRRANEHQILKEFVTLLSIPNVASDTQNIRKNAALIVEMMKQRGLSPRLLEGSTPDTPSGKCPAHNGLSWSTRTMMANLQIRSSGQERSRGSQCFVRLLSTPADRSFLVQHKALLSIPTGASTRGLRLTTKPA